jgi:hypothetical protein
MFVTHVDSLASFMFPVWNNTWQVVRTTGKQYNAITGNGLKGLSANFISKAVSLNPDNKPAASCLKFNRGRYAHLLDLQIFLVEEQDHWKNPGLGSCHSAKLILDASERGFVECEWVLSQDRG